MNNLLKGFKFSLAKTVCVHFHNKRGIFAEPNVTLNGQKIKVVREKKFLGLVFDQKLSFIPHLMIVMGLLKSNNKSKPTKG